MAQFRYVAKSRTGERQEGALDAPDKRALLAQLGRLGLVPISVVETSAKEPSPAPEILYLSNITGQRRAWPW